MILIVINMVVIAVSLLNRAGKIMLSRQFVDITKAQIEGFLGSFSKLLDTARQHTFIENESVRFVYQSIDDMYLVLVTTKDSNIVDDLETLRLLQKVVSHYCPFGLDEGDILKSSFDIIMACDDAVSMGHRESVTLSQLLTYADMESAEEKMHREKERAQMQEAKEMAKRKQKEMDKKRALEKKQMKEQTRDMPNFEPPPSIPEPPTTSMDDLPRPDPVPVKKPTRGMKLVSKGKQAMMEDLN